MDISIITPSLMLVGGLALLWFTGDRSVHYSKVIAHMYGLSTFFVGFVLMAISTGLPELAITITSVTNNVGSLSAGTIMGSNLSDIALVLGLPACFIGSIQVFKTQAKNLTMMLIITILVMASVFVIGTLTWMHGVGLIILYVYSLWFLWKTRHAKKVIAEVAETAKERAEDHESKVATLFKLALSVAGLLLASEISVRGASVLAEAFEFPIESIGATIFAIGTSLPELSLSMIAVKKKDYSLALGNAFGSVLEQGTLILGILALISRQPIHLQELRSIAPFMFFSFGVAGFGIVNRRRINRFEGVLMLTSYVIFLFYYYIAPFYS